MCESVPDTFIKHKCVSLYTQRGVVKALSRGELHLIKDTQVYGYGNMLFLYQSNLSVGDTLLQRTFFLGIAESRSNSHTT